MDSRKLVSTPPTIKASAIPIFWEPYQQSGERIIPLFLLIPDDIGNGSEPKVVKAIRSDRLASLLGAARAASAEGILFHISSFISQMALEGHDPADIAFPFQGFYFGSPKRIRAYSTPQLLNTALRTVCAFGNPDGMFLDDAPENKRNSVPTRAFISALRTYYAKDEKELKDRFNVPFRADNSSIDITIDYAHKSAIAQIASAPATERQAIFLQQEAESKILELGLTFNMLKPNAHYAPKMIINNSALKHLHTDEARSLANDFIKRIQYMSKHTGATLHQVSTPAEGAYYLKSLA